MGAKVTLEQQENLGIVARAALKHALAGEKVHLVTSAVAQLVPLLAESDIRMLMYDCDGALSNPTQDHHAWADLMITLRRVDRP